MRDKRRAVRLALGRTVKELRDARGLSQDHLAELAGLTGKFLGHIERGRANPTVDTLARLAAGLSVEIAALFTPIAGSRPAPRAYTITPAELAQMDQASKIVTRIKRRAARARGAARKS